MRNGRKVRPVPRKNVQKSRRKTRVKRRTRNSFSGLIVNGIRSLVAALPSSKFLSPLVDLKLTSLALTSQESTDVNGITTVDDVKIFGISGLAMIKYTNILSGSPTAVIDNEKGPKVWVNTPYTNARLISIEITVSPTNTVQSRTGRWGCVFLPFRNSKDEDEIRTSYRPVDLPKLQQLAGSVSGPADQSLTLQYRPKPADGFAYQYNTIGTFFGAVILAYSDNIRRTYHGFKAEDFSPDVTIKGKIQLQQPTLGQSMYGYYDKTWTPSYPIEIYVIGDLLHLSYKETTEFECKSSESYPNTCCVKGHAMTRA